MTIDEIRELIKVVTETGVAELEVQRGDNRVRILRNAPVASQQHIVVPAITAAMPAPIPAGNPYPAANPQPAAMPALAPAAVTEEEEAQTDDRSLIVVKSPIVGTYYDAPSPGAPPFVQNGDTVHPGQVLCIIESMKLMNEIEAEIAGVIVKRLVANAQPVEYGEALFAVRPL
jgi:acetyl-CoA carboxylase biotin carboxyl carrier protein